MSISKKVMGLLLAMVMMIGLLPVTALERFQCIQL